MAPGDRIRYRPNPEKVGTLRHYGEVYAEVLYDGDNVPWVVNSSLIERE